MGAIKSEKGRIITIVVAFALLMLSACSQGTNYGDRVAVITENPPYERFISISSLDYVTTEKLPDPYMDQKEEIQKQLNEVSAQEGVGAVVLSPAVIGAMEIPEGIGFAAACSTDWTSFGMSDEELAQKFSLVLRADQNELCTLAVQTAAKEGAKTFVHYYLTDSNYGTRSENYRKLAQTACGEAGLTYVESGFSSNDIGLEVEKDIPQKLEQYGTETSFYCVSEPIQQKIMEVCGNAGGIACIPGSFGLMMNDGDITADRASKTFYADAFEQMCASVPDASRYYSFSMYYEDLEVTAAARYAKLWLDGTVDREKIDMKKLEEIMEELTGTDCTLRQEQPGSGGSIIYYSYEPVRLDEYRK